MDIAQWIGNLFGQLPSWLFIPVFIVFAAIAAVVYFVYTTAWSEWPFERKSEWLEKTASKKKGKHGKK